MMRMSAAFGSGTGRSTSSSGCCISSSDAICRITMALIVLPACRGRARRPRSKADCVSQYRPTRLGRCEAMHFTMQCSMDSQLTIRIPRDPWEALDRASRHTGLKSSELVRQALRSYLQTSANRQQPRAARVRHLIGSLESGIPDLAERHCEYVIESLRWPVGCCLIRANSYHVWSEASTNVSLLRSTSRPGRARSLRPKRP